MLLSEIRIDGGTQPRASIDQSVVAEYAEAMRAGTELPPVVVFFDGAAHWLADGFHRYHAARAAGLEAVETQVRNGTQRDAVLFSVGANADHGLRRTNEDKRRAVLTLLRDAEWASKSDRWISERCGVGHPFVASVRRQLESDSSSPASRTGKDGKTRKTPSKPAAQVPSKPQKGQLTKEQRAEVRRQIAEEQGEAPGEAEEPEDVEPAVEDPAPDLSTLDAREEAVGIAAHPLSRLMAEWPKGASMSPLIHVLRYMLNTCERIEDGLQPKDRRVELGGESTA